MIMCSNSNDIYVESVAEVYNFLVCPNTEYITETSIYTAKFSD